MIRWVDYLEMYEGVDMIDCRRRGNQCSEQDCDDRDSQITES